MRRYVAGYTSRINVNSWSGPCQRASSVLPLIVPGGGGADHRWRLSRRDATPQFRTEHNLAVAAVVPLGHRVVCRINTDMTTGVLCVALLQHRGSRQTASKGRQLAPAREMRRDCCRCRHVFRGAVPSRSVGRHSPVGPERSETLHQSCGTIPTGFPSGRCLALP
jgi:hypothetical protein